MNCGILHRNMPQFAILFFSALFLDNPLVDGFCLAAEVYPELYDAAAVGLEWGGVALFVDLADGFLGRSVELELHDVYVFARFQYEVYAAVACAVFNGYVEAHEAEDDEEHVLIVNL